MKLRVGGDNGVRSDVGARLDVDGRGYRSAQQLYRFVDKRAQFHIATLRFALAAEGEDLADEILGAVAGFDNLAHVARRAAVAGNILQYEFTEAENCTENVVEVV